MKQYGYLYNYTNTISNYALQTYDSISGYGCSIKGLFFIEEGDHLIVIKDACKVIDTEIKIAFDMDGDKNEIIYHRNYLLVYKDWYNCYGTLEGKNILFLNDKPVVYVPQNIDLKLWYDIFFTDSEKCTGILTKKH